MHIDEDRAIVTQDPFGMSFVDYLPGEAAVDLIYNWEIDDRKLNLHRANAINETVDEDGVTHGDTTYSYGELNLSGTTLWPNDQEFDVTFEGSWAGGTSNPNVTWNWEPYSDYASQSKTAGVWRAPYGTLNANSITDEWEGTPTSPQTVTITYSATDNIDGVTGSSTYVLTLHDPVEKVSDDVIVVTVSGPLWGSGGTGNQLFRVNGPAAPGSYSVNTGHGSSTGWGITVGTNVDIPIGKFLIPLGIEGTYQADHESNMSVTATLDKNVPTGKYTYPMYKHGYNRHIVSFRHFLPSGEHIIGDGTELHKVSKDVWATESITWHDPIDNSIAPPEFDPMDPPAMPVEPDL